MKFTVSAPGKIILSGEHAVVYGYKGIASSINLRCYCDVHVLPPTDNEANEISLNLKTIPFEIKFKKDELLRFQEKVRLHGNVVTSPSYQSLILQFINKRISADIEDIDFIKQGLMVFLDLYCKIVKDFQPMKLVISSEFSYGCGLGSSAAYSTVLATAFLIVSDEIQVKCDKQFCLKPYLECISGLAFRGEQIVHGTPSGIDNCISAFGGSIIFQRDSDKLLKDVLSFPNYRIMLVDTGVKRCTKTVVSFVRKGMENDPVRYFGLFGDIHAVVDKLSMVLPVNSDQNVLTINGLIKENHRLLRQIGVSHEKIETVVGILDGFGIASKLTGAGWGGCVYGMIEGINELHVDSVKKCLHDQGFQIKEANLNCKGVEVKFIMTDGDDV